VDEAALVTFVLSRATPSIAIKTPMIVAPRVVVNSETQAMSMMSPYVLRFFLFCRPAFLTPRAIGDAGQDPNDYIVLLGYSLRPWWCWKYSPPLSRSRSRPQRLRSRPQACEGLRHQPAHRKSPPLFNLPTFGLPCSTTHHL
jgi:hypothetical protein